jgi:hypothetical protein
MGARAAADVIGAGLQKRSERTDEAGQPVESVPVCYIDLMTSKTVAKRRRTTMVPVTTMEEIPVLSEKERTELTASLKKAAARVKAGKGIDYDPKIFKDRLVGIYCGN